MYPYFFLILSTEQINKIILYSRLIEDTVGSCGRPRVGWQIDPFGHSREQASLYSQFGFDGVFFARLDHDDKNKREREASLDFAWQGSANIGINCKFYMNIIS